MIVACGIGWMLPVVLSVNTAGWLGLCSGHVLASVAAFPEGAANGLLSLVYHERGKFFRCGV